MENLNYITMDDLKQERRWLPKRSNSKAPIGKSNDPSTWLTYEQAMEKSDRAGFVVCTRDVLEKADTPLHPALKDRQIVFIDIDVLEGGSFTQQQNDILEAFSGKTYIEKSQSGRGRHIYALCALDQVPDDQGKAGYGSKSGKLEMYVTSNRYAIVTGNQAENSHPQGYITDQTALVMSTLETYFGKSTSTEKLQKIQDQICATASPEKAEVETSLAVIDVISRARRGPKGPLFSDLFDNGYDNGKHGTDFPSQSEADNWVLIRLATLSDCDPRIIYNAFMQSQLAQREKTQDRGDYLERSIAHAIDFVRTRAEEDELARPPFVIETSNGEKVVPTKLAQYIRDRAHYIFVKDGANSGITRYWYIDGYYKEVSELEIKGLIKAYINDYKSDLLKMRDVNEVYNDLTTDLVFTSSNEVNTEENLINFKNGVLNVDTMELLPHSPDYIITRQIPTAWDPEAAKIDAPYFHDYMAYLCDGLNEWNWSEPYGGMSDIGIARYILLMQFLGVAVSNVQGHRFKQALIMFGPGNSGKSQLKKFAEAVVGQQNCCPCSLTELEARFGTAQIHGKRLIGSADMPYMTVKQMDTFKKITGGDLLFAEHKGKDSFEFTFDGVAWFCANALPKFGGDQGEWVYKRILPLKCEYIVPPDKQDPCLLDKMRKEIPAIIPEAIEYLRNVRENNYRFSEPPECAEFRKQYQAENDTVTGWVRECCHVIAEIEASEAEDDETLEARRDIKDWRTNPGNRPTVREMFTMYKRWCNECNNGYIVTKGEFTSRIADQFGGKKRYSKGITFTGICLKAEWSEEYSIEKPPLVYDF